MKRITLLVIAIGFALFATGCLPSTPAPPGPVGSTAKVFTVPSSVDGTGRTDVSQSLNAFIASRPDGSAIELAPGAQYRVETSLQILNRHNLTIRGNGATIVVTTPGTPTRSNVLVRDSSNIVFENVAVKGANPNGGTNGDYVETKAWQAGFTILSSDGVTLTGVTVSDTYGDAVYMGLRENGAWTNHVLITGSRFTRTGRQGITLTAARNIVIDSNSIYNIRRATFDFEPRADTLGADNVVISNNDVGSGRLRFVAAQGFGPVNHITISGNRLHDHAMTIDMRPGLGATRYGWTVVDNTSDLVLGTPEYTAMWFSHVDGLVIRNNTQPFAQWRNMRLARLDMACHVAINGNVISEAYAPTLVDRPC